MLKLSHYRRKRSFQNLPISSNFNERVHIHKIKSSDAIGRAQYLGNGNGPLLPIEL